MAAAALVAQAPDQALVPDLPELALEARLLDLADLVVEAELLRDLLSRQSFSAAMAKTTP